MRSLRLGCRNHGRGDAQDGKGRDKNGCLLQREDSLQKPGLGLRRENVVTEPDDGSRDAVEGFD